MTYEKSIDEAAPIKTETQILLFMLVANRLTLPQFSEMPAEEQLPLAAFWGLDQLRLGSALQDFARAMTLINDRLQHGRANFLRNAH